MEILAPQRSLARHPLFQVILTVQNTADPVLDLPRVTASALAAGEAAAKFDLEFTIREVPGGGLAAMVTGAADLFDAGTVAVIADRFIRVLHAAADAPETLVHQIPVLDPAERHQIVAGGTTPRRRCRPGAWPGCFRRGRRRPRMR